MLQALARTRFGDDLRAAAAARAVVEARNDRDKARPGNREQKPSWWPRVGLRWRVA
jgi:hypothetical protein